MATETSADPDRQVPSSDQVRYSTGAIVLHWLLALAMALQVALGFAMPHRARTASRRCSCTSRSASPSCC